MITRALGHKESVEIDLTEQSAQVGDVLLLCSDGLSDLLDKDEILAAAGEHPTDLIKACGTGGPRHLGARQHHGALIRRRMTDLSRKTCWPTKRLTSVWPDGGDGPEFGNSKVERQHRVFGPRVGGKSGGGFPTGCQPVTGSSSGGLAVTPDAHAAWPGAAGWSGG
jgi:hypothetical protein